MNILSIAPIYRRMWNMQWMRDDSHIRIVYGTIVLLNIGAQINMLFIGKIRTSFFMKWSLKPPPFTLTIEPSLSGSWIHSIRHPTQVQTSVSTYDE